MPIRASSGTASAGLQNAIELPVGETRRALLAEGGGVQVATMLSFDQLDFSNQKIAIENRSEIAK